jgi:succinate semialdehyde reductase (NADPH)
VRVAILDEPNSPMQIEDIPVPEPKAGEVLIKVVACGVCHTDLHVMRGEVAFPTPCVLGHEISGTVAGLGAGVKSLALGDRVVCAFIMPCGTCTFCVRGRDDLCEQFFSVNRLRGTLYDGTSRLQRRNGTPLAMYSMAGLAEYCVSPATAVFRLPDNMPHVEAAVTGCALFTAYGAVRHGADLRVGDTVAVVGVGGVGSNIIQVASAFGAATVIAIDIREDKLEAAVRLGATHTVNSAEVDPLEEVQRITGSEGVDIAFEALGISETVVQAFALLRDGGRMVAVGIAPGKTTAPIEITRLVRRSLRIAGHYGGRTRSDMPQILGLASRGILSPGRTVSRYFGLEQVNEAYDALGRGEIVGRAVIVM